LVEEEVAANNRSKDDRVDLGIENLPSGTVTNAETRLAIQNSKNNRILTIFL
jgi:hypothetical protein